MIQLRHRQPSLWHSGLAKDIEDLWEPWMKEVDQLLEDAALVESVYDAQGKRHPNSRTHGRTQTPTEVALRLLILKHVRNWSYDTLEREVRANVLYRIWVRGLLCWLLTRSRLMKRAVFLDRDGVINRKAADGGYVTRWEDFHFLPGVAEAISLLDRAGWSVIVISNQRCVAKGLLTIAELEAIHQKMLEELARSGAKLDGIYYCPHDTEPPCSCRKPSYGMLLTAAQEHQIDLTSSWVVGDSESDIEAGKRAGCGTVRIIADLPPETEGADCFARSLLEASERVLTATDKIPRRY